MSDSVRTYYVATANSVYGGHPVTPERLAKAVEAMAKRRKARCVDDRYPCEAASECERCPAEQLLAALAVLAGEE